jgi:hypothetical protein
VRRAVTDWDRELEFCRTLPAGSADSCVVLAYLDVTLRTRRAWSARTRTW